MDTPAQKIGRYLVLEGGPTRFLAYDPELGRKLDLDVGIDPQQRGRAQRLGRVVHPNVVRLHDVGLDGDRLYLAFDHVEGESLRAWCERERPPWRTVLDKLVAAGHGLAAAHRAGLTHGAIGLDAFVLGNDESVRVHDFVRSDGFAVDEDDAVDRIAFATALHEALFRHSADERTMPRKIRRIVQEAHDAPPSVETLLARLRTPRPRVGRWVLSVGAMALVAAAFAAQDDEPHQDIASSTYCNVFDARLDALWNDEVRTDRARAVAALEVDFAVAAWDDAAARIDAFVADLSRAQARDCERREAGEAVPEAVSLCLHRRFESLSAFLRALEEPSTAIMANLSDSVAALGSPQECEAIEHQGPQLPGVDLAVLLELEARLSDAVMQEQLGRSAEAMMAAKEAMRLADSLGSRYHVAEAEFIIAQAQWNADDEEAVDTFHRAFAAALASEHTDVMCKSAVSLAALLAQLGRSEEARNWLEHAAAAQERTADEDALARIETTRGELDFYDGNYALAKTELERALQLTRDDTDAGVRFVAEQLHAATLEKLGEVKAAVTALEATVEHAEQVYGAQHPVIAAPLISLATALYADGRLGDARTTIDRAVAITEAAFGKDHYGSISARIEQIVMLDASGEALQAVELAEELLDTAKRALGEDDIRYPGVLDAVARVYFPAGRRVEAIALLRDAVRLHEASAGANHPSTIIFLGNLTAALLFSGRPAEAEVSARIVLARYEEVHGPDHPNLVGALMTLAQAIHEQGRHAEAAPVYHRALDIGERHEMRGQKLGAVQFNYASTLWDGDIDRPRALELAREALRSYTAAERDGWDLRQEIDATRTWLNAREKEVNAAGARAPRSRAPRDRRPAPPPR